MTLYFGSPPPAVQAREFPEIMSAKPPPAQLAVVLYADAWRITRIAAVIARRRSIAWAR
jgi:hypothetical protein